MKNITILRLPAVKHRTGLSRATIYLRVSQNAFPRPISLGGRTVGWIESEIEAWLSQRIEQRQKKSQPDSQVHYLICSLKSSK